MSDYKRISCDFYDHFEIYASRKTWVSIVHKNGTVYNTRIKNLQTANKEEFAIIESGKRIRLDDILELSELRQKAPSIWRVFDMIDYDHWANIAILSSLKEKASSAEIVSRISHIINAQDIWLDRISNKQDKYDVWQNRDQNSWAELIEANYQKLLISMEEASIEREIYYHDLSGKKFATLLGDIIHHVVNHGTYHRGQIMEMIRQLGYPTTPTDYIYYVRFRR